MDVIVTKRFCEGTGVTSDLFGKSVGTYVFDEDDCLGIIGCILSAVSERLQVSVDYCNCDDM